MLVGYGEKGEMMKGTYINTKKEADHQIWYPKETKWDDDFEFESDPAKGQIHQKSMIFGFLRRNQEKQKCIHTTSLTSFSIFPKTTSKHKAKKLWIQNLQNLTLQAKL